MSREALSRYVGAFFAVLVAAWIVLSLVSDDWNNSAQIVFVVGGVIFCFVLLPLLGVTSLVMGECGDPGASGVIPERWRSRQLQLVQAVHSPPRI